MFSRVLCVLVGLFAVTASATTMIALDVPEMTRVSAAVVRGTVASVSSRWNGDHSRIVTDAVIDVSEAYKGSTTKRITVTQPGGEVGDIGQRVEGVAKFSAGEELVVFLEAHGDAFIVTGMSQGKFTLTRQADGTVRAVPSRAEAMLLDPQTRQPVSSSLQPMTLEALVAQIRMPGKPGTQVEPQNPKAVQPVPAVKAVKP